MRRIKKYYFLARSGPLLSRSRWAPSPTCLRIWSWIRGFNRVRFLFIIIIIIVVVIPPIRPPSSLPTSATPFSASSPSWLLLYFDNDVHRLQQQFALWQTSSHDSFSFNLSANVSEFSGVEFLESFRSSSGKRNTEKKSCCVHVHPKTWNLWKKCTKRCTVRTFSLKWPAAIQIYWDTNMATVCCIGTPKWLTWRNRLLERLILFFFFIIIWRTSRYRSCRVCVSSLIAWHPQVHCFIRCTRVSIAFSFDGNVAVVVAKLPYIECFHNPTMSKMLNHNIADAKDRCVMNVSSLISSKTDWSQFFNRIEVLFPVFNAGK